MNSKEIISLSDFEHVLKRPTIYIGSVEKSDEKIPIIKDNKIELEEKSISVGYYKLLHEILDNAFDEAKRVKGKMKSITLEVFSSGRVIVSDTGDGFYKGYEKNSKTGLSNVETAMSQLRAGSNFENENTKENLIGTNGVGASLVNMLSEFFEITTSDGIKCYRHRWENFKTTNKTIKNTKNKGTVVDFSPRKDIFKDCNWDFDILKTEFVFKNYIKNLDPILKNVDFIVKFDNQKIDINIPFIDKENVIEIDSKIGRVIVSPSFPKSTKLSFINGQMCSGIHQKIIQDNLNTWVKDDRAHEFYDTFVIMNLEPKDVVFGDQNKTRFVTKRDIIEPIIDKNFKAKLKKDFIGSSLFTYLKEKIEERNLGNASKKVSQISKKKKIELSDKYYPASGKKELILLAEGQSAIGSLNQRRDTKTMGTYALKGKVKNTRELKDLTTNAELAELIQIIGLDLKDSSKLQYQKIVIATDSDPDGGHISSLILNFIYKWFPYMIEEGRLYQLVLPLVTASKGSSYLTFNTLKEYNEYLEKNGKGLTNVRYLKGLGSLSIKDWDNIFKNIDDYLVKFEMDENAEEFINLAFGNSAEKRKVWLTT